MNSDVQTRFLAVFNRRSRQGEADAEEQRANFFAKRCAAASADPEKAARDLASTERIYETATRIGCDWFYVDDNGHLYLFTQNSVYAGTWSMYDRPKAMAEIYKAVSAGQVFDWLFH